MKKDIHPKYHNRAEIHCACGNKFTIGATKEKIDIEICANCHPFYTGKEKLVDVVGKVERFKKRKAKATGDVKSKAKKKAEKKAKKGKK